MSTLDRYIVRTILGSVLLVMMVLLVLGLWWVHAVVILLAVAMMRGPELAGRMRFFGARA